MNLDSTQGPEKAELVTMRMLPSGKQLAIKLARYLRIRGRGKLFEFLMKEKVESIKQNEKTTRQRSK